MLTDVTLSIPRPHRVLICRNTWLSDFSLALLRVAAELFRQVKPSQKANVVKQVLVAREDDIPEGGRVVVAIADMEIGLFRVDGAVLAYRNECPHQGGPVCQGRLMQGVEERLDEERRSLGIHYVAGSAHLVCPWHGWEFDLRSGRHCGHDAERLLAHPVTIRDGGVYVGIRG